MLDGGISLKGRQGAGRPTSTLKPTPAQRRYLKRGLKQPGGKLPLFSRNGKRIDPRTIRSCMEHGWCEPWYQNPIKPDWIVCRLTKKGRLALGKPST